MIRHIAFFTDKAPENIDTICEVDLYGNDVDIVVYAEFEDRVAFDACKAHPNYDEATRRVRPLRDMRYAAEIVPR